MGWTLEVPDGAVIGIMFNQDDSLAFYNANCDVFYFSDGSWGSTNWTMDQLNNEDINLTGLDSHDISHTVIWRKNEN